MSTTLHSFIDIFKTEIMDGNKAVRLNKIVIPLIQRDYAQGRLDDDASRVRSRFLTSLYEAIVNEPITLDFVYGDIDDKGTMNPLDGQQRLTTLFLLHWYAAKKEKISEEKYEFLKRFSYETRYSARYFCEDLVDFSPAFEGHVSDEIVNQAWFPLDWKKDPTISSMLVMLDAIDKRFRNITNIWERLENGAITFYFLPIRDMGLTDELYIKMNSRGKPLTQFEHFKAELEREIRIHDEKNGDTAANRISESIDKKWTDLLWNYRNGNSGGTDDYVIDDEFLRYFKFICDIICYRSGKSPQGYSNDVFDLLHSYFSAEDESTTAHIATFESFFNCWCNIDGYDSPTDFLKSFMSVQHEPGKIIVDSRYKIDIFEDCIHAYSDRSGRIRQFPLNRIILLYAITVYLQNQNRISRDEFVRRIRIVNNLIQNSEDEISDRLDRNRIPAILQAVDAIILTGEIDETVENNFNMNQIQEEKDKITFLAENPEKTELLFRMEDHYMLRGQVSIIGLENLDLEPRFVSLFSCDWDKIDCALMATGDYGQQERNKWRYQYASKGIQQAWYGLFHKSANIGFEKTKKILLQLLSSRETFDNSILDEIISSFLVECESAAVFPWRYYYIKYPAFRPGSYGKLSNDKDSPEPYMFSVMQTKSQWSQNTYMPYLKETDDAHLSRDSMGQCLVYQDVYITCQNAAYIVRRNEDDSEVDKLMIEQNTDGYDTEDRVVKLKEYIQGI
ncbi:MAG: DUF262 domain-containing protein [Lachnospiraceae bacterium]|nr:DUF262 domain-containing protein [Lachnospiraceae bacterium]